MNLSKKLVDHPLFVFISLVNVSLNLVIVIIGLIFERRLFDMLTGFYIIYIGLDHGIFFLKRIDLDMIHFYEFSFIIKVFYTAFYLSINVLLFYTRNNHKSFFSILYYKDQWIHTLHLCLPALSIIVNVIIYLLIRINKI